MIILARSAGPPAEPGTVIDGHGKGAQTAGIASQDTSGFPTRHAASAGVPEAPPGPAQPRHPPCGGLLSAPASLAA